MLGRRKAPWVRSTASPFAGWCGRRPFKAPHAQAWVSPVSRVPRQGLREELRPSARGDRDTARSSDVSGSKRRRASAHDKGCSGRLGWGKSTVASGRCGGGCIGSIRKEDRNPWPETIRLARLRKEIGSPAARRTSVCRIENGGACTGVGVLVDPLSCRSRWAARGPQAPANSLGRRVDLARSGYA